MEAALAEERGLEGARDVALRVIANVRLAVSGEAAVVERAVVALAGRGARPRGGRAGRRQDDARPCAGAVARLLLRPHPADARRAAERRHRRQRLRPAHDRVRVPPGAGVRQRRARRRAQPRVPAHAVGAARVDAGAPGDGGRRRPSAGGAVLRDRDPEPDRAGRHLPAARGAARPLRAAARARLPGAPAPRRACSPTRRGRTARRWRR